MAFLLFVLGGLCVLVMGFAIQRGATCMVAAIAEVVESHKSNRLRALMEAAVWVTGAVLLAHALGLSMHVPGGFAISAASFVGGALLGLGAWLNNACVFGTVGRLGNGEVSYAASFPGYLVGTLLGVWVMGPVQAPGAPVDAPVLALALPIGAAAAVVILARIVPPLLRWGGFAQLWADLQRPAAATLVIGVAFVGCIFTLGFGWTYMDYFNGIARGQSPMAGGPLVLLLVLLLGAAIGGATKSGGLTLHPFEVKRALYCFAGGAVMAIGSLFVPGYNDGLILLGLPLLLPHAIAALVAMVATITVLKLADRWRASAG